MKQERCLSDYISRRPRPELEDRAGEGKGVGTCETRRGQKRNTESQNLRPGDVPGIGCDLSKLKASAIRVSGPEGRLEV